jgi:Uma2 family endonuclease
LGAWLGKNDLGIVLSAACPYRLKPGLVRMPDASVTLWERLPGRRIPREQIPDLAPDLAVEVSSRSNTAAEMHRKIGEYSAAECKCVWLVDPSSNLVSVYASPDEFVQLRGDDIVTAPKVLPGFEISVSELFRRGGL